MFAVSPLLALAWNMPSMLEVVLLLGMTILTVGGGILIGTRWGQTQALAKCVALSLIAHLLLLIYAYGTHIFFAEPSATYGNQQFSQIHLSQEWAEDDAPTAAVAETTEPPLPTDDPQPTELAATEPVASVAPDLLKPAKPLNAEPTPPTPEPQTAEPQAAESEPQPVATVEPSPVLPDTAQATPQQFVTSENERPVRAGDGKPVPAAFAPRMSANRMPLLGKYGGNPDTEKAVANALEWLANNQSADGRWEAAKFGAGRETRTLGHDRGGAGAKADTGISALAILAFLGRGETHLQGTYRENVQHGLEFLLASQTADGNLAGKAELFAAMYCHSISTLALGEAYVMTGDRRLEPALKRAVSYSLYAQNADGSWRYRPGDAGDMSQFGWQVMALRSAQLGGIEIPAEVKPRMQSFLKRCSLGESRGLAAYRPGDGPSRTMTAEALACRYFLDSSNDPAALTEASEFVLEELPGSRANFYYWYYGTVAMFQRGGNDWDRWNKALQGALLDRQRSDSDFSGSWDPDPLWGGYGGRVFSTSLGALCLEAYYRYLPVILSDEEREMRLTTRPGNAPQR